MLRLDYVPDLVDENLAGRSEMCLQFAQLIHLALSHVGMDSNAVAGTAMTKEKNSSMGTFEGQMSVQDPIWQ